MTAGDLVFDVGLHLGEDTAYYLHRGFRVVAFEANPELVAACRARFALEIDAGRLEIVEGAITDSGEPVRFYRSERHTVWGTTDAGWVERNAAVDSAIAVTVDGVDFARALDEYGVPHYMKVDIEGADVLCFEGLSHFEERPEFVSLESEKEDWDALVQELDLLESLGYRRFCVVQQATIPGSTVHGYTFDEHASGPFGDDLDGWTDREGALERYRAIFRAYHRWGDRSLVARTRPGRVSRRALSRVLGRPLPGWYDTHARR